MRFADWWQNLRKGAAVLVSVAADGLLGILCLNRQMSFKVPSWHPVERKYFLSEYRFLERLSSTVRLIEGKGKRRLGDLNTSFRDRSRNGPREGIRDHGSRSWERPPGNWLDMGPNHFFANSSRVKFSNPELDRVEFLILNFTEPNWRRLSRISSFFRVQHPFSAVFSSHLSLENRKVFPLRFLIFFSFVK